MKIALFGFPLTGKSTLFQLLTGAGAPGNGGSRKTAVGMSRVPDTRLGQLADMYQPRKVTPANIEYLDLGGVEKGQAAQAFPLEQLRTADALAHVVRAFDDETLPHTEGAIDPARDVDTMETEFILADHDIAERRAERLELNYSKTRRDEDKRELELMRKCLSHLEQETPLRNVEFSPEELRRLRGYPFLSLKPLLVMINTGEADTAKMSRGAAAFGLEAVAQRPATEVVALSARIERELAELDYEDARSFMDDLGIDEPALNRTIRASHSLLGRMSFFTVGPDEVRAWTIRRGTAARNAAGTIHSDIERGFIRAELVAYQDLIEAGSWSGCRDRGTLRLEGKDYEMQDGDVVDFRFNV